ncbi:Phosphate acyltransferase [Thiorhodovibrio litoralis]|nr:phosphate acyltransferase PlsX [Thiorhodovibrio winogradskyi]WPL13938.1 Phosphate acyltransferase [Thiorhodovibrio litoralis]
MSSSHIIALDAMGGDHGPEVVVPAAIEFLDKAPDTSLILVGREERLRPLLGNKAKHPRLSLHPASQEVGMDELPSKALRNKKDSSMRVALDLVKQGHAHACVSAGNTGALMATARFVLKTLPHVDRPAIMTAVPAVNGRTHMLDLGANVDCTAEHLFQFAVMGSELVRAVDGVKAPRVGLLNIGAEEIKGNEQVRKAYELLSKSTLNFVGYVEGDDIYLGDVDVVVCDGFVGNIALKTSEGVARLLAHLLKAQFNGNLLKRLSGLIALPVLRAFRQEVDPRRYNGASLLGLRGIVIKSHGGADVLAFENAIHIARKEIQTNIPERLEHEVVAHFVVPEPAGAPAVEGAHQMPNEAATANDSGMRSRAIA